jgi:hypothetical protein
MRKSIAITFGIVFALFAFTQTKRIAQLSHSASEIDIELTDNFGLGPPISIVDSFVRVSETVVVEYKTTHEFGGTPEMVVDTFVNPPHLDEPKAFMDSVRGFLPKPGINSYHKTFFTGFKKRDLKEMKKNAGTEIMKPSDKKQKRGAASFGAPGVGDNSQGPMILGGFVSVFTLLLAFMIWAYQSSKIPARA